MERGMLGVVRVGNKDGDKRKGYRPRGKIFMRGKDLRAAAGVYSVDNDRLPSRCKRCGLCLGKT